MNRHTTAACMAALAAISTCFPAHAEDQSVKRGAKLYENNCATCHGEDLQNNSTISYDLRKLHADEHERFINSVTNGKNAMPSWDGVLTDQNKEDLWAYIRANAYDK